jgi:hypothetical protein
MGEDDDTEEPLTPAEMRKRALRYRQMATTLLDQRTIDALISLAEEYEEMAERMEQR